MKNRIHSAQVVLPCVKFNQTLEFFTEKLGFRLEMIFPADSPSTAVILGFGVTLRLEKTDKEASQPTTLYLLGNFPILPKEIDTPDGIRLIFKGTNSKLEIPEGQQEFVLTTLEKENSWIKGRAGMQYRDLIPSRLGGKIIASHIKIPKGGEVPDYVHYHKIQFQMIYCLSGWAKLVYENQGKPFIMKTGDCVLQPPEIKHRVLESSKGLEVLEIGCPAIHETFAEHKLKLPNDEFNSEKLFGGQKFVHHIAEKAIWENSQIEGFEFCDTGILKATKGLADVRTLRAIKKTKLSIKHFDDFLFFFVLKGKMNLLENNGKNYQLKKNSSFVLPKDSEYIIEANKGLELLRVCLSG